MLYTLQNGRIGFCDGLAGPVEIPADQPGLSQRVLVETGPFLKEA